jgi:4-hydroxy 2-oxovalerate aldolase
MSKKNIKILDCTLRDGSYAIDYKFTTDDTARIAVALEEAGVRFIEIGHGVGFRGSPKHGQAAATDEEYIKAAKTTLKKAKFGMFCIPGIAELGDLDMAAKYGMGFVRVGTNITEIEQAEPFIKKAKKLGMVVSSNLMKSYALPINEVIKKAKLARDYGVDIICVVDSAGGMLPENVYKYVSELKKKVKGVEIGFHGHNNLSLAIANTMEAVKAGATVVDTTLQGMGRSVGNAQTEIMAILLEKQGYSTDLDALKLMDAGDKIIRPMMPENKGIDSLSATLGYARFHSGFLGIVKNVAEEYHIDPRILVVEISKINIITVTEKLAREVAAKIKSKLKSK